jgi:hypothetical protein
MASLPFLLFFKSCGSNFWAVLLFLSFWSSSLAAPHREDGASMKW